MSDNLSRAMHCFESSQGNECCEYCDFAAEEGCESQNVYYAIDSISKIVRIKEILETQIDANEIVSEIRNLVSED